MTQMRHFDIFKVDYTKMNKGRFTLLLCLYMTKSVGGILILQRVLQARYGFFQQFYFSK